MEILAKRGEAAGTVEGWRALLRVDIGRRDAFFARPPAAGDAAALLEQDMEIAGEAAACGDHTALSAALCAGAANGAAALLRSRFGDGRVLVEEPGHAPRALPPGPGGLLPAMAFHALAMAVLARDAQSRAILCAPGAVATVVAGAPPDAVGAEPYWAPWCEALAALARGESEVGRLLDEAGRLMSQGRPGPGDPASVAALKRPLSRLMRALAEGDAAGWAAALAEALARFDAYYSQSDYEQLAPGFLALDAAGLCVLAAERGLPPGQASPYLPAWLLAGEFERSLSAVLYEFPVRRARDAREIHWFFDLQGVPREGRTHRLVEEDGRLVACYELAGWALAPRARAAFVLGDAPLLDAAELLRVADLHAGRADDAPPADQAERAAQRAHLEEAVAAMDALLALAGGGRVPDAAFREPPGPSEAGRYERERLAAVRSMYALLLARFDAAPASAQQAREAALASIELIKAQVMPLLVALGRDRSGAVARELQPRAEDYDKVFAPAVAAAARAAYEALWAQADLDAPSPAQTEIRCHVAPAGMLGEDNELSWHFPGGYRAVAALLAPQRIWVAWKYLAPGASAGLAYDGLVWCDDHWAWFPKPYRVLAGR